MFASAGDPLQRKFAKTLTSTHCGLRFPKSPLWVGQKLLFLDIHDRRIKSVDLSGIVQSVQDLPYVPGGFGVLANGRLFVGDAQRRKLFRPEEGGEGQMADLSNIAGFYLCDSVIDSRGGVYVADTGFDFLDPLVDPQPSGIIIYVRKNGRSSVVARNLYLPSGMVVTPDNKSLVIAETLGHRLTAFEIKDDGSLKNRRVWAQLQDQIKPDGICLDSECAIWVAGTGRMALHVREGGEVDYQVTTRHSVFAAMLGGPELKHLFLCTSDSNDPVITHRTSSATIDIVEVNTPGIATHIH